MMCSPQYKCHPVLLYAIKQQCSSSAMRSRRGSAESLVSPVPLKPKSSEERPDCLSAVAEQCMGSMFPGAQSNSPLPFFISPAYSGGYFASPNSSHPEADANLEDFGHSGYEYC